MLYTIYTDGSCLKNPGGPGGYAAVIFREGEMIEELSGGEAVTTYKSHGDHGGNYGAAGGARAVSHYAVLRQPIPDQDPDAGLEADEKLDLWARLDQAAKPHRVSWQWIRGHNGNAGNVRADALANQAARLHRVHA